MFNKLKEFTPVNSAIRNAAAPITGGVNCPFVDEATSTAPAFSELSPVFH